MAIDNDGPSDEEEVVSATSNSLVDRSIPKKLPVTSSNHNNPHDKHDKSKSSRNHEGKIIEIRPRYESFRRRSRSPTYDSSSPESSSNHRRRRVSPTKRQMAKAREVLTHYNNDRDSTVKSDRGGPSIPPPPRSSHRIKGSTGGMHARSIDEHYESSSRRENNNDEIASDRRRRRRMYRAALERNVTMEETRRKMLSDATVERGSGGTRGVLQPRGVVKEVDARASHPVPPPPSTTPSYRAIVSDLIRRNEPEKLSQIDRVMKKYAGREEELIGKLDLRYRKKNKKKEQKAEADTDVVHGFKGVSGDGSEQSELSGSAGAAGNTTPVETPKKDRSAIQYMQTWDRKHTETSEEEEVPAADDVKPDPKEKESDLAASTRTDLHSNTDKDEEDEGRLPKVPETETLDKTPPRPIETTMQNSSPAFNDDISLITMETKGTFNRNRPQDGGEAMYSYAEMMRRPPASIIVNDGTTSQQQPRGGDGSPTSDEKKEYTPPKIQRLLPDYKIVSDTEKARTSEESLEATSKLDSVEARILARRKLREEQARIEEEEKDSQQKNVDGMTLEEDCTVYDEEESFVGKSKIGEVGVIDNSFSLIESERGGVDGTDRGESKVEVEEHKLDTTLIRANTADGPGESPEDDASFEKAVPHREEGEVPQSTEKTAMPVSRDEDLPLDELDDRMQVPSGNVEPSARLLDETNETESSYVTCTQSPQAEARPLSPVDKQEDVAREVAVDSNENEDHAAAASRDTEIQLKSMEDEIARIIAEKESRFAAEKAVALKKAEEALEKERKARLEAEEARLKAEAELERLKAEAEERLKITELLKEPESSVAGPTTEDAEREVEPQSDEIGDNSTSLVQKSGEEPIRTDGEVDSTAMPVDSEQSLMPVSSMDFETKQELMSIIAEMEEKAVSTAEASPPETKANNEELDDSADIVEKMRSVWALDDEDEDENQHVEYAATSDEDSDYDTGVVEKTSEFVPDDDEDDSVHSDEQSYLPESLQSSPERCATTAPPSDNFPSMTLMQGQLEPPLVQDNTQLTSAAGAPLLSKNDHDIPSIYMPHRQTSASQILDTSEPKSIQTEEADNSKPNLKKSSLLDSEEGEANIHHVAKVTFDGNPAKGQLSFTSGSEVLAHSNQRGDWWLGRCGGRTGWFPASAVVPASEYLSSLGPALEIHKFDSESTDEVDLEFDKLSQEELHRTYDLIRSPSGEDESPVKGLAASKSDPSENVDLQDQPSEPFVDRQNDVRSAYDSMLNEYDSMLGPSTDEQANVKEDDAVNITMQTKHSELNTTSSSEEKKKRLWRSANDPNTGMTYYYNVKTRETTWDRPANFVERKSPAKPQPPVEASAEIEGEIGIKEALAKVPKKSGGKRFLGLFSKSATKKNDARSTSTNPTNIHSPSSSTSNHDALSPKRRSNDTAEAKANAANELVSHLDAWEVDDDSSLSSEGTSSSIFSAMKVKKAIGKVGSKIVGKMNSSPTNASYDVLNDSFSPKKDQRGGNNTSVDTSVEIADTKPQCTSNESASKEALVEPTPEKEAKPASDKTKSRWRSAIDPQTGRTYYFHKDTQETVWEKPSNF